MKEQLEKLLEESSGILAQLKEDATKFNEKGVNTAGTRTRSLAMQLTRKMKEIRNTVTLIRTERAG